MYLSLGNYLLSIQTWNSRPEMISFLRRFNLGFIELEDRFFSQISYYTISCCFKNSCWGIGIYASSTLKPNLLLDYKRENLVIGLSKSIFFVDLKSQKLTNTIEINDDIFFQFFTLYSLDMDDLFIIQTEQSIRLTNYMGEILWLYNVKDIIDDVIIFDKVIQLKTIENQNFTLNLKTGTLINKGDFN